MSEAQNQQHPIGVYLKIWLLLFVLSTASYMVDYFHVESYLRWSFIIVFMLLKAGLIVAVFMHLMWERLAFVYAILLPPLLILTFIGIGALEADCHCLEVDVNNIGQHTPTLEKALLVPANIAF